MATSFTPIAGLDPSESERFAADLRYALTRLGLTAPPDERLAEDLLVLFRRYDGMTGKLGRLLRPANRPLLADWFATVFAGGYDPADLPFLHRRGLVSLAAAGLETDYQHRLVVAWNTLQDYQEPDATFYRTSLVAVRRYIDYLRDFAPYVDRSFNEKARVLCFSMRREYGADLLAEYITRVYPTILESVYTRYGVFASNFPYHRTWFGVFLDHRTGREDLPRDYLETPFHEVLRNVPPLLWQDLPDEGEPHPFIFGVGRPGWYHLAAGNSVRTFLRGNGIARSTWRAFARLERIEWLSRLERPLIYLWALGLGAAPELARLLMNYVLPQHRFRWEQTVRVLAGQKVYWEGEEGPRLLGYLHHLLRDRPDFRVVPRELDDLVAAAFLHYERIQESRQAIERARAAAVEANNRHGLEEQTQLRETFARREAARRRAMMETNWKRSGVASNYGDKQAKLKIVEITNQWELVLEGHQMSHCVGGYVHLCKCGEESVWSLRYVSGRETRSIVTIAVDNEGKYVREARGRYNRIPEKRHRDFIDGWAKLNGLRPIFGWG